MFRKRSFMYVLVALVAASVVTGVAVATNGKSPSEANLAPIPHNPAVDGGSNVTGTASLKVDGTQVHVNLHVRGLSPNLPHAMHIHGILGDRNVCPPASADTNGDGFVSLEEGAPFDGPIDPRSPRPATPQQPVVSRSSGSPWLMRTATSTTTAPSRSRRT